MHNKIQQALNDQINLEIYSAYFYLGAAAYFDTQGLNGFAHWMKAQYQEEFQHMNKLYEYVYSRCGEVILQEVKKPPQDFPSPRAVFEATLRHEKQVTKKIEKLYELAFAQKDYATQSFLKWFIDEQVEEEQNVLDILEQFKLAGIEGNLSGPGLFILNKELGGRGKH